MLDLPPPDPGIEVVVASRGYSKGLVQTEGPQIVVRPEVTFGGIYANLLWKNVSSPIVDGEAQINIGYRTTIEGFELSGQLGYHRQTGVRAPTDEDRWEANFTARRPVGPLALRLAVTYSPDDSWSDPPVGLCAGRCVAEAQPDHYSRHEPRRSGEGRRSGLSCLRRRHKLASSSVALDRLARL